MPERPRTKLGPTVKPTDELTLTKCGDGDIEYVFGRNDPRRRYCCDRFRDLPSMIGATQGVGPERSTRIGEAEVP